MKSISFDARDIINLAINYSWNREGSGTGQEDEEDNNQPINQERNNLSQGQYHFLSMRGISFIF